MGWWKRHTNECAKWENIRKDVHEAIANHDKKEEAYMRKKYPGDFGTPSGEAGWGFSGPTPYEMDDSGPIENEYYHRTLINALVEGEKYFRKNHTDPETGCFWNRYSGPDYDYWDDVDESGNPGTHPNY
jgi:hypothetical protein